LFSLVQVFKREFGREGGRFSSGGQKRADFQGTGWVNTCGIGYKGTGRVGRWVAGRKGCDAVLTSR